MSASHSINRRSLVAALGASGVGLGLAAQAFAAPPTVDQGGVVGSSPLSQADHPLAGLWLAMVKLPSSGGMSVAVPSIFGTDGMALLMFPTTARHDDDIHLSGMAVGTWEPIDKLKGHFTVVQAVTDGNGGYGGSLTIDGYPSVSEDGLHFEENVEESVLTLRDASHIVRKVINGGSLSAMAARRMQAGTSGFADIDPQDPRTP